MKKLLEKLEARVQMDSEMNLLSKSVIALRQYDLCVSQLIATLETILGNYDDILDDEDARMIREAIIKARRMYEPERF